MDVEDRKFQIILKEWEYVEDQIYKTADRKYQVRGWAITILTVLLAFSIEQQQPMLSLLSLVPTTYFWISEAVFQSVQNSFFSREHEIEACLETPNAEALLGFRSPYLGRGLKERNRGFGSTFKLVFTFWRSVFYVLLMVIELMVFSVLTFGGA